MSNNKTWWEQWADSSLKMMNNWNNTNTENKSDTPQQLSEEWLKASQQWLQQWSANSEKNDLMAQMPQQMQEWAKIQQHFGKRWSDWAQEQSRHSQQTMEQWNPAKQWQQWAEQGERFFQNALSDKIPAAMKPYYHSFEQLQQHLKQAWSRTADLLKNGNFDAEQIKNLFDTKALLQFVNPVMGFNKNFFPKEWQEASDKMFDSFMSAAQNLQLKNNAWQPFQQQWTQGNTDQWFSFLLQLNDTLQQQMAPFENMMAKGRETEILRLLNEARFAYNRYVQQSMQLQSLSQAAAAPALSETLQAMEKSYRANNTMPDFEDFSKTYMDTLEEKLIALMRTDQYAALQGSSSAAAVQVKSLVDKATELYLENVPLVTRSQFDDAAAELAALRNKIRRLEKRLAAIENSPAAAAPKSAAAARIAADTKKVDLFAEKNADNDNTPPATTPKRNTTPRKKA